MTVSPGGGPEGSATSRPSSAAVATDGATTIAAVPVAAPADASSFRRLKLSIWDSFPRSFRGLRPTPRRPSRESLRTLARFGSAGAGAFRAEPGDREVAEPRVVAEPPPDRAADAVELAGLDGPCPPAALADEVLANSLADERVEAGAVPEVDVADDAERLHPLEVAVDRGQVERRAPFVEPLGDALGRDRPLGREQRLEDHPAGGRQPTALSADRRGDVVEGRERQRLDPRRLGQ